MSEQEASTVQPPQTEDAPRWPARMSLLTTWTMPATSSVRTHHVPLRKAYTIHVLCGLAAFFLICFFVEAAESTGPLWEAAVDGALGAIDNIVGAFRGEPRFTTFATGLSVLGIELGFLALALLITPWGARDEPLRSSFANALRHVWLHTTHVLVVVSLVGTIATSLSRLETAWEASYDIPRPEQPSPLADTVTKDSQEWKDYQEALKVYQGQYWKWWGELERAKPWYLRHVEFVIAHSCLWSALWLVWALLRAVGARRRVAPIERPPTCEACGYNLLTIALKSRCPECGEPVVLSLGPDARPGTAWERRRAMGRVAAWWRCCVDSVTRPGPFGRQIRVTSHGTDHRRFLLLHLPVIFAIGVVNLFLIVWVMTDGFAVSITPDFVPFLMTVPAFAGGLTVLVGLAISLFVALVVGLWWCFGADKRNLLSGSMRIACYLAGSLTLWVGLAWFLVAASTMMDEAGIFKAMERFTGIDDDLLAWLTWLIPNVVCLVAYVGLVARGTAGLRYANK